MGDRTVINYQKNSGGKEFYERLWTIWLGRWYDLRTFDEDVECDPREIKTLFDDVTIESSDGIVFPGQA